MSQPGAAVRLTAVYRYVVTAAGNQLAGRNAQQAACPACEHDDSAARRALDTLLDELADPPVLARLQELGGLCLPHLTAAAARPRLVASLAETMRNMIAARGRCDWLAGADLDAEGRAVLRRAITSVPPPGPAACWPCLAAARAERDALACLPDIASDGPAPALALCASHLADAAAAAGPSGIRQLLGWQLQCLTARLPAPRARWLRLGRRASDTDCAVCRAGRAAAQQRLRDVEDSPPLAATDAALCVRHHLALRTADPRTANLLAEGAVRTAGHLAAELAEAFDRFTRARSTGASVPESTAWQRAAAFLDGSVFSGRRQPPPADQLHR